jgi:hypothetical protein
MNKENLLRLILLIRYGTYSPSLTNQPIISYVAVSKVTGLHINKVVHKVRKYMKSLHPSSHKK